MHAAQVMNAIIVQGNSLEISPHSEGLTAMYIYSTFACVHSCKLMHGVIVELSHMREDLHRCRS